MNAYNIRLEEDRQCLLVLMGATPEDKKELIAVVDGYRESEQRCWVHKTANVLDKMAKCVQPKAKGMLHAIWMAPTRAKGHIAFDAFVEMFEAKYPKATACLTKDREVLLTFYDFPAKHWGHVRTTNPIESVFATVRLRRRRTKGSGSRVACLMMVFKRMESASKTWRALNGSSLVAEVSAGVQFADGVKKAAA